MSHVNGSGAPAPIVELPAPDLPAPIVIETPPLPAWLCEVSAQPVSLAECLACSRRRAQTRCPFVPSILKALANSRGGDEGLETLKGVSRATGWPILRATSLVGCPRKAWYERHEGRPLEKPSDHWARLRGVIFHAAMERVAGADAMSESRLSTVVTAGEAKAIVTGRVDDYDCDLRWLLDYKSTSMSLPGTPPADGDAATSGGGLALPLSSHVRQLLVYSWLLARNGYGAPQTVTVTYMNMKEVATVESPTPYPDEGEEPSSQRRQTLAEIEAMVIRRVAIIIADTAPAPKPDEGWECSYCPFPACPSWRPKRNGHAANGKPRTNSRGARK